TAGPTSCSANSRLVATPKLPPPPCKPHSRSGSSLVLTHCPSAVITSALTRLSTVNPYCRVSQPMPPPNVNPATPVDDTSPPVTARLNCWVSLSTSRQTQPVWMVTRRAFGSTRMPRINDRSSTIPSSQVENPGIECPPARTASATP